MPVIDLPIGPVEYRVVGPGAAGAPVAVFVHGFLVNATLWDPVAEKLAADGIRCILPDWPLGAHRRPVRQDADLSPVAVAGAVTDLLSALDLHDVALAGSDTGGALCQLALRGDTHRVRGLVLTNCDAFEQFPPRFFVPLFTLARSRSAVWTVAQQNRLRAVRHSPLAFGPLLNRPRSASLTRGWIQPVLDSAAIRRDVTRFARGMRRSELIDAATWLGQFEGPVRLVWGARDKHFTIGLGRRLAAAFRRAQLDEVADATTFVSIDRPDAVVNAIRDVLAKSPE
ncbi:MAG TPA: alpha/beta hydrolase [Streptosporangiaceae bacterium]|nr:alpha/beta hydrolase [Streptosporangiaceae bacterium]